MIHFKSKEFSPMFHRNPVARDLQVIVHLKRMVRLFNNLKIGGL
jgi:hypothetical protein